MLLERNIDTLVDVRSVPKSLPNPQCNEYALHNVCREHGIRYRHCPQLGNKKVEILKLIERPEGHAAIKQLATEYHLSESYAKAIMCSEHESGTCHRFVVAQRMARDYGIVTTHIIKDGSTYAHPFVDIPRSPLLPPEVGHARSLRDQAFGNHHPTVAESSNSTSNGSVNSCSSSSSSSGLTGLSKRVFKNQRL